MKNLEINEEFIKNALRQKCKDNNWEITFNTICQAIIKTDTIFIIGAGSSWRQTADQVYEQLSDDDSNKKMKRLTDSTIESTKKENDINTDESSSSS